VKRRKGKSRPEQVCKDFEETDNTERQKKKTTQKAPDGAFLLFGFQCDVAVSGREIIPAFFCLGKR
jgi:hypothetical protein